MEITSEHSFIINLDEDENIKPLPPMVSRRKRLKSSKKVSLSDEILPYNEEFYKMVAETSQKIEAITRKDKKIRYQNDLTMIFAQRDLKAIHRLYFEITYILLGEKSGKH